MLDDTTSFFAYPSTFTPSCITACTWYLLHELRSLVSLWMNIERDSEHGPQHVIDLWLSPVPTPLLLCEGHFFLHVIIWPCLSSTAVRFFHDTVPHNFLKTRVCPVPLPAQGLHFTELFTILFADTPQAQLDVAIVHDVEAFDSAPSSTHSRPSIAWWEQVYICHQVSTFSGRRKDDPREKRPATCIASALHDLVCKNHQQIGTHTFRVQKSRHNQLHICSQLQAANLRSATCPVLKTKSAIVRKNDSKCCLSKVSQTFRKTSGTSFQPSSAHPAPTATNFAVSLVLWTNFSKEGTWILPNDWHFLFLAPFASDKALKNIACALPEGFLWELNSKLALSASPSIHLAIFVSQCLSLVPSGLDHQCHLSTMDAPKVQNCPWFSYEWSMFNFALTSVAIAALISSMILFVSSSCILWICFLDQSVTNPSISTFSWTHSATLPRWTVAGRRSQSVGQIRCSLQCSRPHHLPSSTTWYPPSWRSALLQSFSFRLQLCFQSCSSTPYFVVFFPSSLFNTTSCLTFPQTVSFHPSPAVFLSTSIDLSEHL